MRKYSIAESMEYCGLCRNTFYGRLRLLKLEQRYQKHEVRNLKPKRYFTIEDLYAIKNYKKPSKFDKYTRLKDLAVSMKITKQEVTVIASNAKQTGTRVVLAGEYYLCYSPVEVERIRHFRKYKNIHGIAKETTAVSTGSTGIAHNRENSRYMTIQPFEMVGSFQGAR